MPTLLTMSTPAGLSIMFILPLHPPLPDRHGLHVRDRRTVHAEDLPDPAPGHQRQRLRHLLSSLVRRVRRRHRRPGGNRLLLVRLHRSTHVRLFGARRSDLLHGALVYR